jgi:hypothetical protein
VYKDRDSGNPIFFAFGISSETRLLWLTKDFITMRILAAPQHCRTCHCIGSHLEMTKLAMSGNHGSLVKKFMMLDKTY